MSFEEDIFEFEKERTTEKCLENLQKYEELSEKITQRLEKDLSLYNELSYSGILIDTRIESDPIIVDLK